MLSPPWNEFLREVNAQLQREVTLHSIGGFAITTLYGLPRPTDDLDYIAVFPADAYTTIEEIAGLASKLAKRFRVFIHRAGVVNLPDGYEDRLAVIPLAYERLHIAVPDPYDLALSKLDRNSPKDRADVKFIADKCNLTFETLMARFDTEMRSWIPNVDRHLTTLEVVWREYFL